MKSDFCCLIWFLHFLSARLGGVQKLRWHVFGFFFTTYLPPMTFSTWYNMTKSRTFWTYYPALLVNVFCKRPLMNHLRQCSGKKKWDEEWYLETKFFPLYQSLHFGAMHSVRFNNFFALYDFSTQQLAWYDFSTGIGLEKDHVLLYKIF